MQKNFAKGTDTLGDMLRRYIPLRVHCIVYGQKITFYSMVQDKTMDKRQPCTSFVKMADDGIVANGVDVRFKTCVFDLKEVSRAQQLWVRSWMLVWKVIILRTQFINVT